MSLLVAIREAGPLSASRRSSLSETARAHKADLRVSRVATWRLRKDWAAAVAVRGAGLAIIATILGIFAFILVEVWPLFTRTKITLVREASLGDTAFGALVSNEHRTHVAGLGADGILRVVRFADGKTVFAEPVLPAAPKRPGTETARLAGIANPPGTRLLTASTTDGRIVLVPVDWNVSFRGNTREVHPAVGKPIVLDVDARSRPITVFAASGDAHGNATAVGLLADGTIALTSREMHKNPFTGEATETIQHSTITAGKPGSRLTTLAMDRDRRFLYGATSRGEILWWSIDDGKLGRASLSTAGPAAITAISLLTGEQALAVGQRNGAVSVWFPVRDGNGKRRLRRIRNLPPLQAPVRFIYPSPRDRGFLAVDASGHLALYHSTTERVLWRGDAPLTEVSALFYAPKADAAYLGGPGRIVELGITNPHPEITLRTLFGKVWYEGHSEPAYIWQSTGSGDDFEPKFSLTPLIIGTLKGTFYSLFLAIPLAVCAAMYASQMLHSSLRNLVKPIVELMAGLPSVVLGFLGGLWLAPRLEHALPALALMGLILPVMILAAAAAWGPLARVLPRRLASGGEVFVFVAVLAAGMLACLRVGPTFESWTFDGSLPAWVLGHTGLAYDQRNAIVVGIAMGFAVIPIIFSVSEDAFSSVPLTLVSGSLALGASRWQTLTRIVLPSASPGIFSAIMIGFGRAVGETMIVLMATGNTPILDWSPFNGFRTLSANIAVEIPEAPQFGTLYRVLFLTALLLFLFTFVINTAAEIVRQRLRHRYGEG